MGCRRWVTNASPLETSAWTMLFGAIMLILASFALESPISSFATAGTSGWSATLWMAIAGSTLAFAFWQIGIRARGPGPTSVLFNLGRWLPCLLP
ncbi:EamA family transporter [Salipiger sp. CCB-MM3]|uniref:EamA family transporter n=1 Tax=Salipiger sp. CCB-MM3 TaxID=1792508 RepID=UPI001EEEEA0B|nr:EamA family transporter [Salipiger sp. CCB-MM3]